MAILNLPVLITFNSYYFGSGITAVSWNLTGEDPCNYKRQAQFLKQQGANLIALQEVEDSMLPILQSELGSEWMLEESQNTKMINCYYKGLFISAKDYDETREINSDQYKCFGFPLTYKGLTPFYFMNIFSDQRISQNFHDIYYTIAGSIYPYSMYSENVPSQIMIVGDMGINLVRKGADGSLARSDETIATGVLSQEQRQQYYKGVDDSKGAIQVYSSGGFGREGMHNLRQLPIKTLKPISEIADNINLSDSQFFKPVYDFDRCLVHDIVFYNSQKENKFLKGAEQYSLYLSANAHNELGITLQFSPDSFTYRVLKNKFEFNEGIKFYSNGSSLLCSASLEETLKLQKEIARLRSVPLIFCQLQCEIERLREGGFLQILGIFSSSRDKKSSLEQLKKDIEQQLADEINHPNDDTLNKLKQIILDWQAKHVVHDGRDDTNKDIISKHRNRFHLPWNTGPTHTKNSVDGWLSRIDSFMLPLQEKQTHECSKNTGR